MARSACFAVFASDEVALVSSATCSPITILQYDRIFLVRLDEKQHLHELTFQASRLKRNKDMHIFYKTEMVLQDSHPTALDRLQTKIDDFKKGRTNSVPHN